MSFDPVIWTINDTPVDELGVGGLQAVFRNRAPDQLFFTTRGLADGAPAFAQWAEIVLKKDGAVWFRGIVRDIKKSETSGGDEHAYTVVSPLWWLEEIVYEQNWNIAEDPDLAEPTLAPLPSARVVLGQNDAGAAIAAGEQLAHILSFAIAAGVEIQAAAISIATVIPWEEMRDRTCAEALDSVLRWLPDVVVWVDHTTEPVTVHIAPRSALANTAIDPAAERVKSLSVRDRADLARPAVVLRYHRVHRLNQAAWEQIDTDFYPDPLPAGWRKRALVSSIDLAGAVTQGNFLEQPCETRAIPSGLVFGGDPGDYVTSGPVLAFWKRKIPALTAGNVTEITLRNGQHEKTLNLVNELEGGAITDWMIERRGIQVERQTVRVEAMYKIDGAWVVEPGGDPVAFTAEILATDATTRIYSSFEDATYDPPEPVPEGLAASIFGAIAGPWADIALTLGERECSGDIRPGQLLDSQPVQQVTEYLPDGETAILAGPPSHLGQADLVALLRARRDRVLTDAWRRRKTGKSTT